PTFVSIIDLDRLEVQAYVDETDIGRIFLGQPASFTVDTYPDAEFTARVTAINPKAELQNGVVNYIVLLSFDPQPDHTLRPEMTAHVRLQVEQRPDVLTLPRKAIRRDQGRSFVTVLRDDRWVDQQIQPGWRTDRRIEIQQGLAEGETVQLNAE
ncbi:MAG: HlyD family efflux transporter periplasmic adaptor subunit, partial [Gammaproteobacteria bacterium]|nr:HlyD family efflux transporter periplasmic adaptor subunit [Gammaproteobacteria bacterium]